MKRDRKIKVGIVGLGDVSIKRFIPELMENPYFELCSVVDVLSESEKLPIIRDMRRNDNVKYFQIQPFEKIPEEFFDGVDVVYVASPNEFHMYQTLNSIYRTFTVTEKPLVRNKGELTALKLETDDIKGDYSSRLFCQDHYIFKPVTMYAFAEVPRLLDNYGKIEHIKVTFFEEGNLQGLEREKWLMSPTSGGGVFIDTGCHMAGILVKVFNGEFIDCEKPGLFDMYPNYDFQCETGFYDKFSVKGEYFIPNHNNVEMKIAKGVKRHQAKTIEVNLENADLILNYMKLGRDSEFVGNRIRKYRCHDSGFEYTDGTKIKNIDGSELNELEEGLYLIEDGVCRNLIDNGRDEFKRHEYQNLLDKIRECMENGNKPFLDIEYAERALHPVFMSYEKVGGVNNMKLERTFYVIEDFVYI